MPRVRSFKDTRDSTLLTIGAFIFCGIPTWFWLFIWRTLEPTGFWQKAFVLGFGLYMSIGLQFLLGLFFIYLCVAIWER